MKSLKDYITEVESINEKASSKQQQKFFGMAHAIQKGEKVKGASPELKKVAKSMGKQDVKDFASTKHKGLPTKVDEQATVTESVLDDNMPGSAFQHILDTFKAEVKQFEKGGDLDEDLYHALYDYYSNAGEMPYGIMKARTGDPFEWVTTRLHADLGLDESVNPVNIPAVQRKDRNDNFPVSMSQVQDAPDSLSDLQSLRARAGMAPSGTTPVATSVPGIKPVVASQPMGTLERIRKLSGL